MITGNKLDNANGSTRESIRSPGLCLRTYFGKETPKISYKGVDPLAGVVSW